MATKRTYNPSKTRQRRTLGFRAKNSTVGGKKVIKRRMLKGRKRIV